MRKFAKYLAIAGLILGLSSSAYAENGVDENGVKSDGVATTKNVVNLTTAGVAPVVDVVNSAPLTNTSAYEAQIDATQKALNAAAVEMGKLLSMSHNSKMQASGVNIYENFTPTAENLSINLSNFFKRLAQVMPENAVLAAQMTARLDQVYAYNFGVTRTEVIDIAQVSNEGKGSFVVGQKFDAEGKVIAEGRTVRYVTAPGLFYTIQNEREVIAVEKVADGSYKVAEGIFYFGQEKVVLKWDPRSYSDVTEFLLYHNVKSEDLQSYLKCGDSTCVPYSENKTVNTKAAPTVKINVVK